MTRRSRSGLIAGVLLFGLTYSLSSWAAPVLKEVRVPADVYEKQKIKIRIVYEWPATEGVHEIKVPKGPAGTNVEILESAQSQEHYSLDTGDIYRWVMTLTVKPLSKGQGRIEAFDIRYKPPPDKGTQSLIRRDRRWETISSPPIVFNVRAALPWKLIIICIAIPIFLILPFALWHANASRADRKIEKKFLSDPKQQLYAKVIREFDRFVSGYNQDNLRILLSNWSALFQSVVTTYYDMETHKRTHAQLLEELKERGIPGAEFREIERILSELDGIRFTLDVFETSQQVEEARVSILKYVNGKLIIGTISNPD